MHTITRDLPAPPGGPGQAAPRSLVVATAIGGLGLGAGGTAGALVAFEVTGRESTTGLPFSAVVLGSAVGALLVARIGRSLGRRAGLASGYLLGVLGGVLVVAATVVDAFSLVLLGSLLLGAANASVAMTRYAAAEAVAVAARGRALGAVLAATAVGAIASAYLLGPSGTVAAALGWSRNVGLHVLAVPAFAVAGLLLVRPGSAAPPATSPVVRRGLAATARLLTAAGVARPLRVAVTMLAVANLAMTAIMVVVPVHLTGHGVHLHDVGLLVGVHVAGMFVPAPLTGRLVDRRGALPVGLGGLALLLATALLGAAVGVTDTGAAVVVLVLLGVGWNAATVGGSALLATAIPVPLRLGAEAGGEVAMGLAAAVGAPLAGLAVAVGGLTGLCLVIAVVCALALAGCAGTPEGDPASPQGWAP